MLHTLLVRGTSYLPKSTSKVIATLGSFDGFHFGHLALLSKVEELKLQSIASGAEAHSVVISFHPHPAIVLGKKRDLRYISTLRQRLAVLSRFNIDYFFLVHFTPSFSELSASDFINDILKVKLNVSKLVVGEDAAFGHNREGNLDFLKTNLHDCELFSVNKVFIDNERISSDLIRNLVSSGRVDEIKKYLGRNFILDSFVQHGEHIGTGLGTPTANLKENKQILPSDGVYITKSYYSNNCFLSVTNIGNCPTFQNRKKSVETFFLTEQKLELYNKRIQVEFFKKIRDEIKFKDINQLKAQIKADICEAKGYFSNINQ